MLAVKEKFHEPRTTGKARKRRKGYAHFRGLRAFLELQRTLLFSLAGKEEFREPRTKRTARTRRNRLCELSRFSRISRLKIYSDLQRTLPFLNPEDSRRHLLRGKGFSRKGVTPLRTPGTPPLSGSRLAWRIRSLPGVWRNPPESGRSA